MASWLQNKLRAAEGLLEAVDRTAKVTREQQAVNTPGLPWQQLNLNQEATTRSDSTSAAGPRQEAATYDTDQKQRLVKHGSGAAGSKKAKSGEKKKTIKTGRMSRTSSVASSVNSSSRPSTPTVSKVGAFSAASETRSTAAAPPEMQLSSNVPTEEVSLPPASLSQRATASHKAADPVSRLSDAPREVGGPPPKKPEALPIATREPVASISLQPERSIQSPFLPEVAAQPVEDPSSSMAEPVEADIPPSIPPFTSTEVQQDASCPGEDEEPRKQEGPDWQEYSSPADEGSGEQPELEVTGFSAATAQVEQAQEGEQEAGQEEEEDDHQEGVDGVAGDEDFKGDMESDGASVPADAEAPFPEGDRVVLGAREKQPSSASLLQHELEQARELAKIAVDSGSLSREARLQRVCDKLRARLEELKEENQQLEELLHQADAKASGGIGEAERLKGELKKAKTESAKAISSLEATLRDRDAQLQRSNEQADERKAQVEVLEKKLEDLQETSESLLRERQSSEGRLMTALRDQLAEMEQRLDDERAAHNSTRKSGIIRQEQLEADLSEAANEYSALQRILDERNVKVEDLESHMAIAEEEHERALARLRRAEETASREKARADANDSGALEAQVAAWKEEAEKARAAVRALEAEVAGSQRETEELTKQVKELEAVVKDARGAVDSDLARRFKEVTDLLYLKQTQLEKMAADKAAQQLSMEREISGLRDDLDKAKRRTAAARDPMESYSNDMTPMDHLGAAYQRLANHAQLGGAIKGFTKAVDITAANAMSIMREYPLARVVLFLYSILIHLFVYILIQRLQNRYLLNDESSGNPGMV
eukprot:CAMPEP_0117682706 /NCGR_PEP_ID=MMETSP0804-20121206/19859_1 /TAXON_ID=1074897 /ORGANISM="Tetraselmis astigmatica, Strain CCMP880" /LENGTH=829 /DNA_ID=CAMNT_0005492949 /DNA_START=415 /DNA_END=2904 /DNA_ORIENTATION=+